MLAMAGMMRVGGRIAAVGETAADGDAVAPIRARGGGRRRDALQQQGA